MKESKILVRVHPSPYPVHIGTDLIERLPSLLSRCAKGKRTVVVSECGIAGRRVIRALRKAKWKVDSITIPSGESAKSFPALLRLYGRLLSAKVERRTPLVAVGGGAVGDAAGFAAATYYRGIPLVHVPTSLLAMVDSAVGGKTAVNHPKAKNAIGAFHQPVLVLADLTALGSLSRRDFLSGMAEVVKYALVFDRGFARWLGAHWKGAVIHKRPAELARMIRRCVQLKAKVAASDVRDLKGRRELLNFGHTIGHALESATGYKRFRHGEAVAWGMRAAVELSLGRGWMRRPADRGLASTLLKRLPAPRWPRGLRRGALVEALKSDKKVAGAKNVFVLLRGLADPVRVRDVSRAELNRALERTL